MTLSLAGIYKITNTITGKVYVGQSQNVYERKCEHFVALRHNKHENKLMQHDWNINNRGFRFDVIELCPINELNAREKYWIDKLNTMGPHGYNQTWVPYKRATSKSKTRKTKRYRKRS